MRKLESFYARFGEDVTGIVRAKAKPDGDIKHLLKQLGLPMSGVIDRQHRILVDFIQRYGRNVFRKAITLPGGAIAVRKLLEQVEADKVRFTRSMQGGKEELPVQESSGAVEDSGATIETPTYHGPDRRSAKDRRSGVDRRQRLELITFKNRRFGGKRRQAGRRATDKK